MAALTSFRRNCWCAGEIARGFWANAVRESRREKERTIEVDGRIVGSNRLEAYQLLIYRGSYLARLVDGNGTVAGLQDNLRPVAASVLAFEMRISSGLRFGQLQRIRFK